MRTSDPAIFAIGECAEVAGQLCGTTAIASRHAEALAEYLRGNLDAPFTHAAPANILKVKGLALASAGIIESGELTDIETVLSEGPARRHYRKLLLRHNRVIGAIMLGSTVGFAEIVARIDSETEISGDPLDLLATTTAIQVQRGPVICSCAQVTADTLLQAAESCGHNLTAVCRQTRAGTICGSCRPEIAGLLRSSQTPAAVLSRAWPLPVLRPGGTPGTP